MLETTEAIILNSRKYGETSKIVTVFSKNFGKFNLIVKGASKAKNKFGSALEPMSYVLITFYRKPANQLQLLSNAELVANFLHIRQSLESTAFCFSIIETINKILEEHYVNEKIFSSIIEAFEQINQNKVEPFNVYLKFLFIFLNNLGFEISTNSLNIRNNSKNNQVFFDIENGLFILINNNENNKFTNKVELNINLFDKISQIINSEEREIPNISFSKSEIYSLINLFSKYLNFHIEKSLYLESLKLLG
ncbi:MAG: DNA repair protein RecO [Candidatus Kapaibacteriota bacterium]